ncbi:biotin transporter BioY [Brevibacillus migulae]|uniref:biotin transporter BioY n=1 Tax=Brevibacillus migulae TaxID=1644114 RepID=UPI00106E737B|nr:biotin transporter BioY [Brevibacillus migulae]
MSATSLRTMRMMLVAMFAALTAIGAYIKIPLAVDPFTLQILFVFLAGALLGSKGGMFSQLVYLSAGLAGLPVFTSGGGIAYIFKPTFGYLIGFVLASYLVGKIIERSPVPRFSTFFTAHLLGLIPVYGFGMLYLYLSMNTWVGESITFWTVFVTGFSVNIAGDLLLAFVGAIIALRLHKVFQQRFYHPITAR